MHQKTSVSVALISTLFGLVELRGSGYFFGHLPIGFHGKKFRCASLAVASDPYTLWREASEERQLYLCGTGATIPSDSGVFLSYGPSFAFQTPFCEILWNPKFTHKFYLRSNPNFWFESDPLSFRLKKPLFLRAFPVILRPTALFCGDPATPVLGLTPSLPMEWFQTFFGFPVVVRLLIHFSKEIVTSIRDGTAVQLNVGYQAGFKDLPLLSHSGLSYLYCLEEPLKPETTHKLIIPSSSMGEAPALEALCRTRQNDGLASPPSSSVHSQGEPSKESSREGESEGKEGASHTYLREELDLKLTRRTEQGETYLHELIQRFNETEFTTPNSLLRSELTELLSHALEKDAETLREILTQRSRAGEILLYQIPTTHFCDHNTDFSLFKNLLRKAFSGPTDLEDLFFNLKNDAQENLCTYLERSAPTKASRFIWTTQALRLALIELASDLSPSAFLRLLEERPGRVYDWATEPSLFNRLLEVCKKWLNTPDLKAFESIATASSRDGKDSLFRKVAFDRLYRSQPYDLKTFLELCKAALGAQLFRKWLSERSAATAVWEPETEIPSDETVFSGIADQTTDSLRRQYFAIIGGTASGPTDLFDREYFLSLPEEFQRSFFFDQGKSQLCFIPYFFRLLNLLSEIALEFNRRTVSPSTRPCSTENALVYQDILKVLSALPVHERMAQLIEAEALCRKMIDRPWKDIPYGLHLLFFGWERSHAKDALIEVKSWIGESKASALSYANELLGVHQALGICILKQPYASLEAEGFFDSLWRELFQFKGDQESLLEVLIKNFFFTPMNLRSALKAMEALDRADRNERPKQRLEELEALEPGTMLRSDTPPLCNEREASFAEEFLLKKEEGKRHWLKQAVDRWGEQSVQETFFGEGAWFHGKELSSYLEVVVPQSPRLQLPFSFRIPLFPYSFLRRPLMSNLCARFPVLSWGPLRLKSHLPTQTVGSTCRSS